ncbi:MAG: hypothetical protein R3330_17490 [Saprospiraceae bacterium]|nr:hypothetical protein [Saprospiraceae bacterium]
MTKRKPKALKDPFGFEKAIKVDHLTPQQAEEVLKILKKAEERQKKRA